MHLAALVVGLIACAAIIVLAIHGLTAGLLVATGLVLALG